MIFKLATKDGKLTVSQLFEKLLIFSTTTVPCPPDNYVAIDETIYPTSAGILFKTYNQDKPTKYGLNSMDRYYTTIPHAEWLLSKNITCIGTLIQAGKVFQLK